VTGNLPVTNLNSGTSASATTFWRGDGTWSVPPGSSSSTSISVIGNSIGMNAFALAGSPGGVVTITITIGTGVVVYAPDTLSYALDLRGFAGGSTVNLVNNGYILGTGGDGGHGARMTDVGDADYVFFTPTAGQAGGTAVIGPGAGVTFNITNASGFIWAGGGGGGGGGISNDANTNDAVGIGGGGGGGSGSGKGGFPFSGGTGTSGTVTAGVGAAGSNGPNGTFGAGGAGAEAGNADGGDGGAGGDWGTAGTAGASPTAFGVDFAGGAGGASGLAVNQNGGTATFISGSGSPHVKGAVT
jgi:hypothetical protein